MSLVKVKTKGEVTLPSALRERAGLSVGDLLEARFEKGKITLTPKSLIDRRIEEGLEDIRRGRTYGPFDTADQMIESLQRNMKQRAKAKKTKRSR
jgi:AbrB family looped-hinge helix DNA binding protein